MKEETTAHKSMRTKTALAAVRMLAESRQDIHMYQITDYEGVVNEGFRLTPATPSEYSSFGCFDLLAAAEALGLSWYMSTSNGDYEVVIARTTFDDVEE